MQIPTEPQSGQPITVEWGRQVVRALRAIWPRSSPDILPSVGAGGTTFSLRDIRSSSGAAAAPEEKYALQVYRSTYTGGGDPPDDQALRVRVRRGFIANKMPSNIDNEFVLPDESETIIYYEGTHDDDGSMLSVLIQFGDAVPDDDTGTLDHAPTHNYRPIAWVKTTGGKVTEIIPDGKGSRDVGIVSRKSDCGKELVGYLSEPAGGPDVTSDTIQGILTRLDVLEAP